MKKIYKRIMASFLSVILFFPLLGNTIVFAEEDLSADQSDQSNIDVSISNAQNSYRVYQKESSDYESGSSTISVPLPTENEFGLSDQFEVGFSVEEKGLYCLCITYFSLTKQDIVLKTRLDGKELFTEMSCLTFPTFWQNENNEWKDAEGDQYIPEQVVYSDPVSVLARDISGQYEFPYAFALSQGEHHFSFEVESGRFSLSDISFCPPNKGGSYRAPEKAEKINITPIIIEGEDACYKNNRALIPLSDSSSSTVHPSSPIETKLNYIGGTNWSSPGQTIFWKVKIPQTGKYNIGVQFRQGYSAGSVSYRSLQIDGKSPFYEANRIKFPYQSSWKYTILSDKKDDPFVFDFSEGEHIISLTVTAGELSEVYEALQFATTQMADLYVDITKVVGETVDIYRSYELFNQVPQFNERLDKISDCLSKVAGRMRSLQDNQTSSSVSIVNEANRIVQTMREKPYSAHKYKKQFYNSYTNISSLLADMVKMPLDIDRLVITGANSSEEYQSKDVSFLEKVGFGLRRFFATFASDYGTVSAESGEETLTIWINWGRDQAQVLNSIIQSDFVKNEKIPVTVKLVNATLINAILAGKGPDCLIQMSRTEPVNLAMRGALVDLSQYPDFSEVEARFHEGAVVPYTYRDGVYALPVTQGFFMMFMRTDILDSLNISPPETWEEFIAANSILQRNNLQAVIPYTQLAGSGTVNEGVGGLTLYPTWLLQRGLKLYNKELTASTLTQIKQIQTFCDWTDCYTKYKFQEITNFYNRFRIGSAPLGIAPYTLYTELKAAAPEIAGRWTMAPIPGTVQADGTVDHTSAGWGAGCAITKLSKNPDNAWKFLKWWTSARIQLKYSDMLESVLGPLGRVATANTEALSGMDWDAQMFEQIVRQQEMTREIEEIPGGYYTARGIDQAFWSVTESGKDPTEMLKKWGAIVDDEISRKKAEYESE